MTPWRGKCGALFNQAGTRLAHWPPAEVGGNSRFATGVDCERILMAIAPPEPANDVRSSTRVRLRLALAPARGAGARIVEPDRRRGDCHRSWQFAIACGIAGLSSPFRRSGGIPRPAAGRTACRSNRGIRRGIVPARSAASRGTGRKRFAASGAGRAGHCLYWGQSPRGMQSGYGETISADTFVWRQPTCKSHSKPAFRPDGKAKDCSCLARAS